MKRLRLEKQTKVHVVEHRDTKVVVRRDVLDADRGDYGRAPANDAKRRTNVNEVAIRQPPPPKVSVQEAYATGFARFKAHTQQKPRALQMLRTLLDHHPDVRTMLDVGAGDGVLTVPLAAQLDNTVAIEPNKTFASRLRGAGLSTLERTFDPASLHAARKKNGGPFDLILMSHIHYHFTVEELASIQRLAYDALPPGGRLVMIKTSRDDITEELKRAYFTESAPERLAEHEAMHAALSPEALASNLADAKIEVYPIETPLLGVPDLDALAELSRILISPPVGNERFDPATDDYARAFFEGRIAAEDPRIAVGPSIAVEGTNDVIVVTKPAVTTASDQRQGRRTAVTRRWGRRAQDDAVRVFVAGAALSLCFACASETLVDPPIAPDAGPRDAGSTTDGGSACVGHACAPVRCGDGVLDDGELCFGPEAVTGDEWLLALGDVDRSGQVDVMLSHRSDAARRLVLADAYGRHVGPSAWSGTGARWSGLLDFDADGDLDVITTGYFDDYFELALGAGDGTFAPGLVSTLPNGSRPWGDLDRNGYTDFVSVGQEGFSISYNDGEGFDRSRGVRHEQTLSRPILHGDFDGDGAEEIVIARTGTPVCWFEPTLLASPEYVEGEPLAAMAECWRWPQALELDDDEHLDILFATNQGAFALYGRGDGTFERVQLADGDVRAAIAHERRLVITTDAHVAIDEPSGGRSYAEVFRSTLVAQPEWAVLRDVFGAGRQDVVVKYGSSEDLRTHGILRATDDGYAAEEPLFAPNCEAPERDFDGDGVLDLLCDGTLVYGDAGGFPIRPGIPLPDGSARALAAGDLDGDGRFDLVAGTLASADRSNLVVFRGAVGGYEAARVAPIDGRVAALALGDVDDDGRLELAVVDEDGERRLFGGARDDPLGFVPTTADLGADDLLVGGQIYRSEATGLRRAPGPVVRFADRLLVSDLDGDGVLDRVTTGTAAAQIWRGATDGSFALTRRLEATAGAVGIDVADRLYVLGANHVRIFSLDGDLVATATVTLDRRATHLRAGDLDDDGAVDLAVHVWDPDLLEPNGIVILRGGESGFEAGRWFRTFDVAQALGVEDLDADGHVDLLLLAREQSLSPARPDYALPLFQRP